MVLHMERSTCIFILDADASARDGLARLLRVAGYAVHAFATFSDLLEGLDRAASGCVVLDAGIPGFSVDGLRLRLDGHGGPLPVIVVTSNDDAATRWKAEQIGAVGFFRKPVDGTALLDAVAWTLR